MVNISIIDNNGNIITNNNHIVNINPFRYRSYYYDKETNLYYLNSRYYSPTFGRFINADAEFGRDYEFITYNLFVYSNNNPISCVDFDGNFAIALPTAVTILKYAIGIVATYCITKSFAPTLKSATGDIISTVERKKTDTIEKVKEQVKSTVLPKDKVKNSTNKNNSKPCTKAWVDKTDNDVHRGDRLTINEATQEVLEANSVMCDTKYDARKVAINAASIINKPFYFDKKHDIKPGYYYHFHVEGISNHPHIWYLGY